jgi:N-acyl amino acid synthase FeeM
MRDDFSSPWSEARNATAGKDTERSLVEYSMACDTRTLDGAFRLTHDQYVRRGYMLPHPTGRRLNLYHALPTTKVLVARCGSTLVGTISIVEDSPLGLPMEEIYRDEVSRLRDQGRRVSEVSALAMDADSHGCGMAAVLGLLRMIELYAADVARLDDACISVNPRHVGFYRKFLDFEIMGPRKSYHRVNGAPAEALRLDLRQVRRLIRDLHTGRRPSTKQAAFMFGTERYREVMAQIFRDVGRSALSRAQFLHFFARHESFTAAPASWREYVASFYADRDIPAGCLSAPRSRVLVASPGFVSAV